MAWYAYWKWCHWWMKKPIFNWIEWYREEIKSPEQKKADEIRKREAKQRLAFLAAYAAGLSNFNK